MIASAHRESNTLLRLTSSCDSHNPRHIESYRFVQKMLYKLCPLLPMAMVPRAHNGYGCQIQGSSFPAPATSLCNWWITACEVVQDSTGLLAACQTKHMVIFVNSSHTAHKLLWPSSDTYVMGTSRSLKRLVSEWFQRSNIVEVSLSNLICNSPYCQRYYVHLKCFIGNCIFAASSFAGTLPVIWRPGVAFSRFPLLSRSLDQHMRLLNTI
jgi:hypothetical protein